MRRMSVAGLALGALLASAAPAAAQICAGFPTGERQFSFGGSLSFPENADQWGVEASYNAAGPVTVFGGMRVTDPGRQAGVPVDPDAYNTYRAGLALDPLGPVGAGGVALSLCPWAEFEYASISDAVSLIAIPVGLGLGARIDLGAGGRASLFPFVTPLLLPARLSIEGLDSDWETDWGVVAGGMLGVGMFYVGAEVIKVFLGETGTPDPDAVFSLRAGIRL